VQQYLTRKGIVERAQQRGIPLTYWQLVKDSGAGRGPRLAAVFGGHKCHLHTPEAADEYIDSKITLVAAEAAE
jgi:hypothetical protein